MIDKYLIFLLMSVVISSFAQVLLKKGALVKHDSVIREYLNVFVIGGYALMFIATAFTVIAYSGMEYKNAPIIESLGYVIIMILCRVFFGEPITKRKLIGNILVLVGIVVFYI